MAEITTKITPLPKVAGRFDTDFIETADKFLNQLPNTCVEMNNYATQANEVKDDVNILRNQTQDYKNKAYGYKTDAEQARNDIKSYVIPTNATYSQDTLDENLDELLRGQILQQILLKTLEDNKDIENLQQLIANEINKTIDGLQPVIVGISKYVAENTTIVGGILNYKTGDVYEVKSMDTNVITEVAISGNRIFYTTSKAGEGFILVTRIRNGIKTQTIFNVIVHA